MSVGSDSVSFRQRLLAGEPLAGVFVKTPNQQVVELLAGTGLDFIVLDAEHAPFDAASLSACLFAARALSLPALVRVADDTASGISRVLDLGATGILVPHVDSAAKAEAVGRAARFGPGGRGFSNSTRAGGYGASSIAELVDDANRETVVVAQIEDPAGVTAIEAIAGVDGIDALFIGRADLAVGFGATDLDAPEVTEAVGRICAAGRNSGRPLGMFLGDVASARAWRDEGVSLFVVGSEQRFIRTGAQSLAASFREALQ